MKTTTTTALLLILGILAAAAQTRQIRVATYNTSLFRDSDGELQTELAVGNTLKPRLVAEIIQRVDPDIILLNEFDYDAGGAALESFVTNFLEIGHGGQSAIIFPYSYIAESNTGIASCLDLNNNGSVVKIPERTGYGDDALGFGQFEGQYGMVVLSKFPIKLNEVRTFQKFLWEDMPGALLPDDLSMPAPADWYDETELGVVRLSSKSHWDLPIDVDGETVHLLAAHPTPPIFDGAEDRNGRRNHDEIRLWADYIGGAGYLYDDAGRRGGLAAGRRFVICGDYNADPVDGDSFDDAISQLLDHPAVDVSIVPQAASGTTDTSTFGLRVDYVLPSRTGFEVLDGEIFWPATGQPGANLVGASDHRLVWMDLEMTPLIGDSVRELEVGVEVDDVVLSWLAREGIDYRVEVSTDLATWGAVGVAVGMTGSVATLRDLGVAVSPGRRFYRVLAEFAEPG